jgi:hypothetical protein
VVSANAVHVPVFLFLDIDDVVKRNLEFRFDETERLNLYFKIEEAGVS